MYSHLRRYDKERRKRKNYVNKIYSVLETKKIKSFQLSSLEL